MPRKILFVGRDGTLVREPDNSPIDSLNKLALMPGVIPALLKLQGAGYELVLISNQDGLGTDTFPMERFEVVQTAIRDIFSSQGIRFLAEFFCPHTAEAHCTCRKPATGLLTRFLATHNLDTQTSAVVGSNQSDLVLATNLGLEGYQITADGPPEQSWAGIADTLCHRDRVGICKRKTKETSIEVSVNLDSTGDPQVATGIGFFDHMLEQLAKHGAFALQATCEGDLHIDDHHTVEDIAIAIGSALRDALGTKHGIQRYGFLLPMDESEAQVSIDLSGRAAFAMTANFPRNEVGGLTTEMVRHFFLSWSSALGCALHITVRGENTHHMVEACFKAVGRALRQAIHKSGAGLPTTKGLLS